ncbi:MAG: site-2 protease family protein [Chthonomonadales bacterium]
MIDKILGIGTLIIVLTILVVAHEWGHYAVARWFKMRVDEFALFFGPVLVRLGKRGDTEFNIRSVPFGGFVKIAGMDPDDISGGRPILQAIRDPQFSEPEAIKSLIRQFDKDTLANIDPEAVSPDTVKLIRECTSPEGVLLPGRREDLELKQASPDISPDDKRLIQMALLADSRANDKDLYSQKPIYQRALAIFGGPFASLAFGFLVFCMLGMTFGLPSDKETNIVQVLPSTDDMDSKGTSKNTSGVSPSSNAGMKTGDKIVSINATPTPDGKTMKNIIWKNPNKMLKFAVERDGQTLNFDITPLPFEQPKVENNKIVKLNGKDVMETVGRIGVYPMPEMERVGPIESVKAGSRITYANIAMLLSMFTTPGIQKKVGGPVAMGQMTIAVRKLGLGSVCMMMASYSLSLGILNLLPIPILDGGHLVLLAVEKIRKRRLSPKEVYRAQVFGLAMLAVIVCFVMYNDIFKTLTGRGYQ